MQDRASARRTGGPGSAQLHHEAGATYIATTAKCETPLDRYFAEVKTTGRFADAVFVMVANRLVRPWSKRRTVIEWLDGDVSIPDEVTAPALHQCYRALDTVAAVTARTEAHLYQRSPS